LAPVSHFGKAHLIIGGVVYAAAPLIEALARRVSKLHFRGVLLGSGLSVSQRLDLCGSRDIRLIFHAFRAGIGVQVIITVSMPRPPLPNTGNAACCFPVLTPSQTRRYCPSFYGGRLSEAKVVRFFNGVDTV